MRNILPGIVVVFLLFTVWALGYQSACERDLARAQGEAAAPMFRAAGRQVAAATMPTTAPVVNVPDDEDEEH